MNTFAYIIWMTALAAVGPAASVEDAHDVPPEIGPTRAPTHPDCDHRVPMHEHEVQLGEQLGLIAGRYGVRRTDVERLNPQLANPDLIRPGQKIRVCPEIAPRVRTRIEYVVQAGDRLEAIARKYDLTVREVLDFQPATTIDPDLIRVGQKIVLWVDGGIVADFLPPEPSHVRPPKGAARSRGTTRSRITARLPQSGHYHLKRPHLAYGTSKTIGLIRSAVKRYHQHSRRSPKVNIGNISRQGGGALRPHLSHRSGRDVDIGYVLVGDDANRTHFSGVSSQNLDVARTWSLVRSFLETREVAVIFMDYHRQKMLYEHARKLGVSQAELDEIFQYPRGHGRAHGIIRHWRGHRHHFHVRFRG